MKILIWSDDPLVVVDAKRALEENDHRVATFHDRSAFLKGVSLDHPDLVVLDGTMRGSDGLRELRSLRSDPRTENLPVILLTEVMDEVVYTCYQVGADMVLTKPFDPRELLTFRRPG